MKVSLLAVLLFAATSCLASTECQSTFHTSVGTQNVTICISDTGNIVSLIAGQTLLDKAEGYAICEWAGGGSFDTGLYGDSGNWQSPVISQPRGPNTFPLTISRSVDDGRMTLVQKYQLSSGHKGIKVTMTVSSSVTANITLRRWADVIGSSQVGDHTLRSAFVWSQRLFGMAANPLPNADVGSGVLFGGNPGTLCNSGGPDVLPYSGDAATTIWWNIKLVAGRPAKSVSFEYLPIW